MNIGAGQYLDEHMAAVRVVVDHRHTTWNVAHWVPRWAFAVTRSAPIKRVPAHSRSGEKRRRSVAALDGYLDGHAPRVCAWLTIAVGIPTNGHGHGACVRRDDCLAL